MKRGISPLIATVLIIGFMIAIAGIVTTFLLKSTKDIKFEKFMDDNEYCDQVAIAITEYGDCSIPTGSTLESCQVALQNKGSFSIYGVIVHGTTSAGDNLNVEGAQATFPLTDPNKLISENNPIKQLRPGKKYVTDSTSGYEDEGNINADYKLPKGTYTLTPIIKNQDYDGDFDPAIPESGITCTRSTSTIDLTVMQ